MTADTKGFVVITGASSGIGKACALRLDALGYHVFAGVRREADAASLYQQASQRLLPLILDVTDADQIKAAVQAVTRHSGDQGLVGLINNAGIAVLGPLEFLPINAIRQQFEVNVIGPIAVTQAFAELLRQGQGRIVHIGSSSGRWAEPFLGAYAASKFALEALTDVMRFEMQLSGIHVSIVEPGAISTPIWDKTTLQVDKLTAHFSERAMQLYGTVMARFFQVGEALEKQALPPEKVAEAVVHALTAKTPKTRYLVGRDAQWAACIARWVPDRLRDRLIHRNLNL